MILYDYEYIENLLGFERIVELDLLELIRYDRAVDGYYL